MFVGAPTGVPTVGIDGGEGEAVGQGGSAAATAPAESTGRDTTTRTDDGAPAVAQGSSGSAEMETGAFWEDLGGFLLGRVRDEAVAKEAAAVFKQAWKDRRR